MCYLFCTILFQFEPCSEIIFIKSHFYRLYIVEISVRVRSVQHRHMYELQAFHWVWLTWAAVPKAFRISRCSQIPVFTLAGAFTKAGAHKSWCSHQAVFTAAVVRTVLLFTRTNARKGGILKNLVIVSLHFLFSCKVAVRR